MLRGKFGKKANKNYEDIHYSCTIRFLDDSEPLSVTYQKDTKGQWLIDHVCKELNLAEKDYFGLRCVDAEKQRHWLDPTKSVYRQLKNVNPMVLCFRVKFYPTDPSKLKEEITRYFLFLQLRRDLHHGRLLCSPTDANLLAAYIIQSEVGDYDPQDHQPGYVSQFKMLPKQTQKQEEKISEIHKTLLGEVPAEAESNFLKKAASLDTYGVDPHPVKDQKGNQMYLGVTHLGIVTFQGNKRTHLFKWPQITKLAFEGKMFIVHVTISEGEENALLVKRKKHACGFKCPTFTACKHLWKCAVEQQYFFTLAAASDAPRAVSGGGLFSRGSKFRFSGRCQREVYSDSQLISREEPAFQRSSSNPAFVRSFGQSRTMSLPSKFKDSHPLNSSVGELEDSNHVGTSNSLDNITTSSGDADDSLMSHRSSSFIGDTIEEEEPVSISDQPYQPIASPVQEELPDIPNDLNQSSPDIIPQTTADLDAQIQQLQAELQQCRMVGNHVNQDGTDADDRDGEEAVMSAPQVTFIEEPEIINEAASPELHHAPQAEAEQSSVTMPSQAGLSCCKALTCIFFFVFFAMLVVAFVVLESELDVPVLKDIRHLPEVQDFKQTHYSPMKNTVARKMGGLFKG